MQRFFSLIQIENIKMWKRISTRIMPLILIVVIVGFCGLFKYIEVNFPNGMRDRNNSTSSQTTVKASDWKTQLEQQIKVSKATLAEYNESGATRLEKTQIGGLEKTIAEDQYRLDNNLDPARDTALNQSIWARMIDADQQMTPGFVMIIALFLIIACSAAVAGEFSEGTMKMMITRPFHRAEILTAKMIAILTYGVMLFIETLVVVFISSGLFYGFHNPGSNELLWTGSQILSIPGFLKMFIVYGLEFLTTIVYVIFALMLATLSRSRAMATGFSLFLLLVGGSLLSLLAIFFDWGKYILFTVTSFSGFIVSGSSIVGTSLSFALILSLIYSAVFLFVAYFTFEKRDI